jgi:hypothetical protein
VDPKSLELGALKVDRPSGERRPPSPGVARAADPAHLSSSYIGRNAMTAFNAVRFKVKPGREQEFLDAHKKVRPDWAGLASANIIKTGERAYCIIAEWTDMDALAAARPHMITTLDTFRDTLEDLGGGLGVTDPTSGSVVLKLK